MSTISTEYQQFFKDKRLEGEYRPEKWLKIIYKLSQMDEASDRVRKIYSIVQWSMLGVVVLSLLAIFFGELGGGEKIAFGIIAASVLIAGIFQFLKKQENPDLFNNLRLTVQPIFSLMREDFLPGKKVKINLDFDGPIQDKWISERIPKPSGGPMPRIETTFYTYPWMQGEATLKDQTYLKWEMASIIRHRHITKRGSSGKIKFKIKCKTKHRIFVKMSFPKSIYQPVDKLKGHDLVTETENSWVVRIKREEVEAHLGGKRSLKSSFEKKWMSPDLFLSAVGMAYRLFQPIK